MSHEFFTSTLEAAFLLDHSPDQLVALLIENFRFRSSKVKKSTTHIRSRLDRRTDLSGSAAHLFVSALSRALVVRPAFWWKFGSFK